VLDLADDMLAVARVDRADDHVGATSLPPGCLGQHRRRRAAARCVPEIHADGAPALHRRTVGRPGLIPFRHVLFQAAARRLDVQVHAGQLASQSFQQRAPPALQQAG
jgi:hypothetical protein